MATFNTTNFNGDASCNLGGLFDSNWQADMADRISVETGVKRYDKAKIDLLNKKYEEAKYYKLTGTAIDDYVAKACKVSTPVAKVFRSNIEMMKKAELDKQNAKIEAEVEKEKKKGKTVFKWYHYAILGGGMLALIALSPTLNTLAKSIPSKRD